MCCCCCCTSAAVRRELLLHADRRGCFPLLAAVQRGGSSSTAMLQQLLQFCRSCLYTPAAARNSSICSSRPPWLPVWQKEGEEGPHMLCQGYQASEVPNPKP